jgi:hypothetical protein
MSHQQINKFFEENYSWLKKITKGNIYLYNSLNKDVDECISLMYMHVIERADKIADEDKLIDFCGNFSIKAAFWANSKFNKIASHNSATFSTDCFLFTDGEYEEYDDSDDIRYDEMNEQIAKFIEQLEERWERIYATVYFNYVKQGIKPSVRTLKKHFGIGHTPSQKLKKEFELKFQDWLNTQKSLKQI